MDSNIAYMPAVGRVHEILDKIQNAALPESFGVDFLKDMGFTSSNDRAMIRVLRYLGMIDAAGRPQQSYREFMDHTKAKAVLAARLRAAFDDLFTSDKEAQTKSAGQLKGWFKTKTGASEAVAEKMASTFKSLADYADWTTTPTQMATGPSPLPSTKEEVKADSFRSPARKGALESGLGLVYRFEIHLPDTANVDTFRAIFRAIKEELL